MLATLFLVPRPAQAASNLQRELGVVAQEIAKFVKDMNEESVSVGEFRAPPQLAASAGPAIAQVLSDEIRKHGVQVKSRAKLGVEGRYRDVIDEKTKRLAAQIQISLVDRAGKEILSLDRGVFGDATLSSLFGATTDLPPTADDKTRDQKIQDALDKPSTNLRGTRISPSPESPYGIEILIKSGPGMQPRQPKDDDGLAFVPIHRHEIYAIKLHNDSPYEAAVTLTIDGLNVFCFSQNKTYTQWIIPPKTHGTIIGWHVTNEGSDSFQVTEYSKSAAAVKMPNSAKLGTITASFAAAWPKEAMPPSDEPPSPHEFARSADATGRGPHVATKYTEVQRLFGVTRAAVSVRYTK
jgi:hypothetical protein